MAVGRHDAASGGFVLTIAVDKLIQVLTVSTRGMVPALDSFDVMCMYASRSRTDPTQLLAVAGELRDALSGASVGVLAPGAADIPTVEAMTRRCHAQGTLALVVVKVLRDGSESVAWRRTTRGGKGGRKLETLPLAAIQVVLSKLLQGQKARLNI